MYIVQKTVSDKWNYWLDKNGFWNGLKENAEKFNYNTAITQRDRYSMDKSPSDHVFVKGIGSK